MALALLLALRGAVGIGLVELQLGALSGAGWRAEGVHLHIDWHEDAGSRFKLTVGHWQLPGTPFPLQNTEIDCSQGRMSDDLLECSQGKLTLSTPLFENDSFPIRFRWNAPSGEFALELDGAKLAGGQVELKLNGTASDWSLALAARSLDLARLDSLVRKLGAEIPSLNPKGRLDVSFTLEGGSELRQAAWQSRLRRIAFSDAAGTLAGEGVEGAWSGSLSSSGGGYRGESRLSLDNGALLTPWFFLQPAGKGVSASARFSFDSPLKRLQLHSFRYHHPDVIELDASGRFRQGDEVAVESLTLSSGEFPLAALYEQYLRPVQSNAELERLYPEGRARVSLSMGQQTALELELKSARLSQGGSAAGAADENISVTGLNGRIHWSSDAGVKHRSSISWQSGRLLRRLPFGAGEAEFTLAGDELKLTHALTLPILDGSLHAERFALTQSESGNKLLFQGYLTPISMKRISTEFGWPPLAGQLSAMIPGVAMEGDALKMRGVALIRMFDGNLLVKNLVLGDLFGALPTLEADVEVKSIDLETLTSTFAFGKITGRLGGKVENLRMEAWRPVSFDAVFATPADDEGSHRISQQAVDNISNLGGVGISGALSRSFLRFFEEFSYDKLGISCRLHDGVCDMGGIEPAGAGYYLVKGGGLPRIDIVGFNRSTDWRVLIEKLKQISEGGTPVIE